MKFYDYTKIVTLIIIALICAGIFCVRHSFDKLYGSGYTQEINKKYTLFMTDSTDGFLIDKNSDTSISIVNPIFEKDFIYGEYKLPIGDKKYFLFNITDNIITQLSTKNELFDLLKSLENERNHNTR